MSQVIKTLKQFAYNRILPHQARKMFHMVMKRKREDTYVIYLGPGIGDVVYGMAYMHEFKRQNPNKKVVVLSFENAEKIVKSYVNGGGCDETYFVSAKIYRKLFTSFWSYKKTIIEGLKHGFFSTLIPSYWTQSKDTLNLIRNRILRIGEGVQIQYHGLLPEKVFSIPDFEVTCKKVVLVNGYSNSCAMSDAHKIYFEKIVKYLKENGYLVYSNIVGAQEPIKGSRPLQCSLEELLGIAYKIPLIISMRSGILDFIMKTNINMFVFYQKEVSAVYTLSAWKSKGEIMELNEEEIAKDENITIFKNYFSKITS